MDAKESHLQRIFAELSQLSIAEKTKFHEILLFTFTIAGRGIWSDDSQTDNEKVNAYKWLNELLHRIWNIHFDLQDAQADHSIDRLAGNIKFYGEQSDLLRAHLFPTILTASKNFTTQQ